MILGFTRFSFIHCLLSGITDVVDCKQRLLKVISSVLEYKALFRMQVAAFTHATTSLKQAAENSSTADCDV